MIENMGKLNSQPKTHLQRWALYGAITFAAFMTADLTIVYVRDLFLPKEAPPKKSPQQNLANYTDRSQYSTITARNLFSSKGEIPEPFSVQQNDEKREDIPVPSNLPLNLIGTLVHSNPSKSVAAIEVKSKNMTGSYLPGAEIENMARIEKIERGIVYFRNLNNNALEYIEMNKGNKVSFDSAKPTVAVTAPQGKEIQNLGNNTFRVKKSDLDKYLKDMSSLLMQARAIPNHDKNGEINGFRLVDYQPGSIFDQLGIPRGTLIESVGGTPIRSVQDAMSMFNDFKSKTSIPLGLEINGVKQTFNYEIQQ